MKIAAFIPNIFDRSRFSGEHRHRVTFIDDPEALADLDANVVIVDLDRCPDPAAYTDAAAAAPSLVLVGFGPHVDTEGHREARDLGFHLVLPRSNFFRRLPDLLADPEHNLLR
jgi:hypothetical protein